MSRLRSLLAATFAVATFGALPAAAQALLAMLDGKRVSATRQDLGFELMVRESS